MRFGLVRRDLVDGVVEGVVSLVERMAEERRVKKKNQDKKN